MLQRTTLAMRYSCTQNHSLMQLWQYTSYTAENFYCPVLHSIVLFCLFLNLLQLTGLNFSASHWTRVSSSAHELKSCSVYELDWHSRAEYMSSTDTVEQSIWAPLRGAWRWQKGASLYKDSIRGQNWMSSCLPRAVYTTRYITRIQCNTRQVLCSWFRGKAQP